MQKFSAESDAAVRFQIIDYLSKLKKKKNVKNFSEKKSILIKTVA